MHNYEANPGARDNNQKASPKQQTAGAAPVKVAIVGARGYSGLELARILLRHPTAELTACFASDATLRPQFRHQFRLSDYLPETAAANVATWTIPEKPDEFERQLEGLHTVFLATPADVSARLAAQCLEANVNTIDFSGAFRLKQGENSEIGEKYRHWYGFEHPSLALMAQAEFGLQPFTAPLPPTSKQTAGARLIANPGCYATSVLMAIVPLLRAGLLDPASLVIDAKSGTSGGGRKAAENLLFTEVEGECLPYKVAKHQHLPEIIEATENFSGVRIEPFFTTHLLNVRRGIVSSIYARVRAGVTENTIAEAYAAAFSGYKLARVGVLGTPSGDALLSLKKVVGTARTHISYRVAGDKLYLFSLIDNLIKGAAGQAIENFNRLCDRPVELGLSEMEGVL